jgi:hypothetical protein
MAKSKYEMLEWSYEVVPSQALRGNFHLYIHGSIEGRRVENRLLEDGRLWGEREANEVGAFLASRLNGGRK